MKIAIASDKNMCCEHFGHCEGFKIYEIKNNKIISEIFVENPGHKPGFLPMFLKEKGINIIVSGGMGEMAQKIFKENNIEVIVGVKESTDEIIKTYILNKLKSDYSICDKHSYQGACEN